MTEPQNPPLSADWKARLDLSSRTAPELYEDAEDVGLGAHAGAIRTTLRDLGASGVFCIQDVPTVVIVELDEYDRKQVLDLHGALWNQGLATLLLVLTANTVRAFSLARKPLDDEHGWESSCLVRILDVAADVLALKNLVYAVESGRLLEEHADYFPADERIDQVLLDNLTATHTILQNAGLSPDGAQALLIQTMFIAYLEDREIVRPKYLMEATNGHADSFDAVLKAEDETLLLGLFERLRKDFNGDLFVAPCAFDAEASRERVRPEHLGVLGRFRSGREEMYQAASGQLRLWGYHFKYMPVELVSAVYDRFLGAHKAERRRTGAYYTPMFLADTAISALWDALPAKTRTHGAFLDPACGSGMFLVRLFQRLCEGRRQRHRSSTIRWKSLLGMLARLHGRDIDAGAVRVTVFSLYVALLQEVEPPDIRRLMKRGKLLPALWGRALRTADFFDVPEECLKADVVVGNPPWTSRRAPDRRSITWCEEHDLPMPEKEGAWGFVWKSLGHLRDGGVVAFLLPAMGFLHNHSDTSVKARRELARSARLLRIVNFADLRFQLFEGAIRPAALMIFGPGSKDGPGYHFDYWTPKAHLNLRMGRVITLSSADKGTVSSRQIAEDPFVFKRRLWMNDPDAKLFGYLAALPSLGDLVLEYRKVHRRIASLPDRWVVGNGFQPVKEERLGERGYRTDHSELIRSVPFMPIEAFRILGQGRACLQPFKDKFGGLVRRKGFERGFEGPRVLVPRGITDGQRLRATYLEEPLTFKDAVLAISVPDQEAYSARLLTALMSSKLLMWFVFHGTASFGSERPEVKQKELLRLPFPLPDQMDSNSQLAADELVKLIDKARERAQESPLMPPTDEDVLYQRDDLCYRYLGLGKEEIALVEDGVNEIIPNVQPSKGSSIALWRTPDQSDRETYGRTLSESLSLWFDDNAAVNVALEASNDDVALMRLHLVDRESQRPYQEQNDQAVGQALQRLSRQLNVQLPGNFQLVPDFRLFDGDSLYMVKPLQRRFWLRSAAIADADALATELHDAHRIEKVNEPN